MSFHTTCLLRRMLHAYILVLTACWALVGGSSWTYSGHHGQENWPDSFPDCGGTAQSPINIKTHNVSYDDSLPPVEPVGYSNPNTNTFTLLNNGHSVQLSIPSTMHVKGLPNTFTAVQLHLHWGSVTKHAGSEHRIDGDDFPGELHVVHYNSDKYRDIGEAMNKPDGLAVLGIFIETGAADNPAYENILRYLENVSYAGQSVTVPSFDVHKLFPKHLDQYFRYRGSLTTPPCYQSVLWTVFYHPVKISKSQLGKLHTTLYSTEAGVTPVHLENNVRDTLPLNGRTVYSSFKIYPTYTPGTYGTFKSRGLFSQAF
ncbi:carbonic anhydrase 14 [Rhinophrynus dorsalis]